PGEAIPLGRPYRTHPNGPHKLLTIRKRVGPFPARRLAWRRVSHRSSSNSLSDLSLVHSSGCDASGQSHSGPSTIVASPRSAPSSTLYPPTTSESFPDSSSKMSLDSSSPSIRQSRKRCRSTATLVPSSTPVSRSIAPALADLSPRERFRDSYSSEVGREEHMEIGTVDAETVVDLGISDGVGAHIEDGIDIVGIQSFYT
ncbi:hypothetical protein Tco_1085770, partial [Tanacetum coccineum]